MKASAGAPAVSMSRAVKNIQSSDIAVDFSKVAPDSMRYAGDKTFIKKNGEWQISTFDKDRNEKNVVNVKFGSPLYFAIISKHPETGKYCALGSKVLFNLGEIFVRISEHGEESAEMIDKIFK